MHASGAARCGVGIGGAFTLLHCCSIPNALKLYDGALAHCGTAGCSSCGCPEAFGSITGAFHKVGGEPTDEAAQERAGSLEAQNTRVLFCQY